MHFFIHIYRKGKKECPTLRPLQLEALWGEIGMLETVD